LNLHNTQLKKYFVSSKAKFGVLTNGIIYRFYTDLIKPNIMDEKPFLEVNMLDLKEYQIEELKKFHKSYFEIGNILSSASELKYMGELKSIITKEFSDPTNEFVKYLGKQVYDGVFTPKIMEQFTVLVKRSIASYINELIAERLNAAIKNDDIHTNSVSDESVQEKQIEETNDSKIVTTAEEIEAFYIIKSILRNFVSADRVTYRDAQTYFAVFLDDNNRKTVCRLYLDSPTNKRIVFLDENKNEISNKIDSIDCIYKYDKELKEAAERYL
jgi:hypothetical protein